MAIRLKSRDELEKMRRAGRLVHQTLQYCRELCKPGVSTLEIDEAAGEFIQRHGGRNLFKNYPTYQPGQGFPANLCISVNEVVVHGIASSEQIVQDGDIVSIDCGVAIDNWCGDSATTIEVGNVSNEKRRLCQTTQHVLQIAIDNVRPGRNWSQVARLMQGYAEKAGYGVVRDFVGHGIGQDMHEDPKVPNFVSRDLLNHDILLREGMVLAIEPMCNLGGKDVITLKDRWTVVTVDRKPSAHFEHTVAITENGAEILTDGN